MTSDGIRLYDVDGYLVASDSMIRGDGLPDDGRYIVTSTPVEVRQ